MQEVEQKRQRSTQSGRGTCELVTEGQLRKLAVNELPATEYEDVITHCCVCNACRSTFYRILHQVQAGEEPRQA